MSFVKNELWYESRELAEESSRDNHQENPDNDQCIRNLLELHLSKSLPDDKSHDIERNLSRNKFKPNNSDQYLPIFTGSNPKLNQQVQKNRIESHPVIRNIKAEAIIKSQQQLDIIFERIQKVDGHLAEINQTNSSNEDGNNDVIDDDAKSRGTTTMTEAGDEDNEIHGWWPLRARRLFWFAWPIFLLAVLNKCCPLIKIKRTT